MENAAGYPAPTLLCPPRTTEANINCTSEHAARVGGIVAASCTRFAAWCCSPQELRSGSQGSSVGPCSVFPATNFWPRFVPSLFPYIIMFNCRIIYCTFFHRGYSETSGNQVIFGCEGSKQPDDSLASSALRAS